MGRIVTNKHIGSDNVTALDFYEGINVENPEERKRIAMGRIILTNREGFESIWILNENDVPKLVAEPSSTEVPSYIREYIASAMTVAERYADSAIESGISEYNALVIDSADTMYNELTEYINNVQSGLSEQINTVETNLNELSAYTMNLKFSDHFMLTEIEYTRLKFMGEIVVDSEYELISYETCRLNDLSIGDVVKYSNKIYYCTYNSGGGGGDIEISGTTIDVSPLQIEGNTLVFNDNLTIDNNTVIIN
jgi:hypothetical protein